MPLWRSRPLRKSFPDGTGEFFNINPNEPKLWDINQADNPLGFDFNAVSSGWYTVYLNTNYKQLTGKTSITADANWTVGYYQNRSTNQGDGAYFRLYFQSAQGNYNMNDYWWSTARCDLNSGPTCSFNVSLTNRTQWTNLCGLSASDITSYPTADCGIPGLPTTPVSPYDGFTAAMRNVKDIGLSFGRASRYASGVAVDNASAPAAFHVTSYSVNP